MQQFSQNRKPECIFLQSCCEVFAKKWMRIERHERTAGVAIHREQPGVFQPGKDEVSLSFGHIDQ